MTTNNATNSPGPGIFDPKRDAYFYEEMLSKSQNKLESTQGNGGSSTVLASPVAGHLGIIEMSTGSTAANGRVRMATDLNIVLLGGGEIIHKSGVNVQDLSDASDEYEFIIGMGDGTSSGGQSDGVYFEYDRTTNTNWLAVTTSGGTKTRTDTSTAVATSTWVSFEYRINAGATSVEFFIDGVSVATNTTNIPSSGTNPVMRILKSADSGVAKSVYVDYYFLRQIPTTER